MREVQLRYIFTTQWVYNPLRISDSFPLFSHPKWGKVDPESVLVPYLTSVRDCVLTDWRDKWLGWGNGAETCGNFNWRCINDSRQAEHSMSYVFWCLLMSFEYLLSSSPVIKHLGFCGSKILAHRSKDDAMVSLRLYVQPHFELWPENEILMDESAGPSR